AWLLLCCIVGDGGAAISGRVPPADTWQLKTRVLSHYVRFEAVFCPHSEISASGCLELGWDGWIGQVSRVGAGPGVGSAFVVVSFCAADFPVINEFLTTKDAGQPASVVTEQHGDECDKYKNCCPAVPRIGQ